MILTVWVLPLVSLVSGVIGVFADPKKGWKRWVLLGWLPVVTVFAVVANSWEASSQMHEKEALERRLDDMRRSMDSGFSRVLGLLENSGLPKDLVQTVRRSASAESERERVLERVRDTASLVTIQYFPKQEDGSIVRETLRLAGYMVTEGRARLDIATDCVWAGDAVTVDDARYVALTLIRAGVGIKAIRRFREGSGPKRHLIQVGSDAALAGRAPLTVEQVASMTALGRAP